MDYRVIYDNWITSPYLCAEGLAELTAIKDDPKEIEYAFGAELEFGTAGMRGLIGYGTNKMNIYTVRRATQGLAEFIKANGPGDAARRGDFLRYEKQIDGICESFRRGIACQRDQSLYLSRAETRSHAFLCRAENERLCRNYDHRVAQPERI